jgi:cGMP-dependent protein kinase
MELYLLHEKQLMETLQFSFIIKLYKTFKDERFVYFLTNYIEGVDFLDVLQQVGVCNKKKAQFFIGCLILCLEYLHEKNIIYRDLKPENIVVENSGFLYLNNFQIAKILR